MRINQNRSQVLTFSVKVDGAKKTDFHLCLESGKGFYLKVGGLLEESSGKLSFVLPPLEGIVESGERKYHMEVVADNEAIMVPIRGTLSVESPLKVEAREVTTLHPKVVVAEVIQDKKTMDKPKVTVSEEVLIDENFLKF